MKLQVIRIVLVALMLVVVFLVGQQSATVVAQSHQRWEYRIVGSIHTVDQINKLGEDGWEVVTLNASNRMPSEAKQVVSRSATRSSRPVLGNHVPA